MKVTESTPAVLLLQDGTLFHGKALGKIGTHGGEICFNTGMTGYQEIYTDPSYSGQVIINTTAHIGNYGVIDGLEAESSQVQIAGMVCNEFASMHSRETADGSLQDYLAKANLVGISGIDTRALVRHIRTKGVMNCLISSEIFDLPTLQAELAKIPSMEGLELSSQVCTKEAYFVGDPSASKKVAVLDLGVKKSILSNIAERDCYLHVFPAKTPLPDVFGSSDSNLRVFTPSDSSSSIKAVVSGSAKLSKTACATFGPISRRIISCSNVQFLSSAIFSTAAANIFELVSPTYRMPNA
jgi:carbamoyl-phosphate synthase small subunit